MPPREPGVGPPADHLGHLRHPEDGLYALPSDVVGMDVVELGCGTAYFSAWLARRGARVTGIDNSAHRCFWGAPASGPHWSSGKSLDRGR
jgi:SAM-dependent methyltransferase